MAPRRASPLPRTFYARDADQVARDLLGCHLVHDTPEGPAALRIVETEAYFGPPDATAHLAERDDLDAPLRDALVQEGDRASHAYPGVTPRNRVMHGPPGHAYVYLIYGMYECFNVTTGPDGLGQAVLVRAGEPVEGEKGMWPRRAAARKATDLASGPGKLTQALAIRRDHDGHDATAPPVYVTPGRAPATVAVGPRVNVVGSEDLPLRYWDAESAHVSRGPPPVHVHRVDPTDL